MNGLVSTVLFWAIALLAARHALSGTTEVIAISGDVIPNWTRGGAQPIWSGPFLNNRGEIAFAANHSSTELDDTGVYFATGGQLIEIAHTGGIAPDGINHYDGTVSPRQLSDSGQIVFTAVLIAPNASKKFDNYFSWDTATNKLIGEGQSAPDGNGHFSRFNGRTAYNNELNVAGQFVFYGEANDIRTGSTGIYRTDGSQVITIARDGQPGPGGALFTSVFRISPSINELNQVAFIARFVGGSDSSLLRVDGSLFTELVRYGQTSPRGDGIIMRVPDFTLNNAGQVAFRAFDTADPSDQNTYRDAFFRADGIAVDEIVRVGDPAPGGNGVFSSLYSETRFNDVRPKLNDTGQIAFFGQISGGTNPGQGLYRSEADGHTLTPVARDGQLAPDGNGSLLFPTRNRTSFNELGQVAFYTNFAGSTGGASDNAAILLWNNGQLTTIARTGGALHGSSISALESFDLNDAGQLAYHFVLSNGRRGVALWSIPEPSGISPILIGAVVWLARRRAS